MSFPIAPTDAIRTLGSALPRNAADVAAAGSSLLDAATPPSAVRAPDNVELSSDQRRRDPNNQTNRPDLARAATDFMTSKFQFQATASALDRILDTTA